MQAAIGGVSQQRTQLIAPEDLMFYPVFKLRLAPCITSGLKAAGYSIISFCSINSSGRQAPPKMLRLGWVSCPDCGSEQTNGVRIRPYTSCVTKILILTSTAAIRDTDAHESPNSRSPSASAATSASRVGQRG